jgi:hypothetical protein
VLRPGVIPEAWAWWTDGLLLLALVWLLLRDAAEVTFRFRGLTLRWRRRK